MSPLIELVATFSPYIYAVCGLVALFQMYRAWQVREERRQAIFSYEREKAIRELYGIFFTAFMLLVVMGFTYFTSTTLAEIVDPILAQARNPQPDAVFLGEPTNTPLPVTPTSTSDLTATVQTVNISVPVEAPSAPLLSIDATPNEPITDSAILPTPTPLTQIVLPPAPTARPPSPTPVVQFARAACSDPNSTITSPGNGQVVRGLVTVTGTANHPNLQYYKIEYAPGNNVTDGFVYLAGDLSPVVDGILASFDAYTLAPGEWTLRLKVVDQTGNWLETCSVTIVISA